MQKEEKQKSNDKEPTSLLEKIENGLIYLIGFSIISIIFLLSVSFLIIIFFGQNTLTHRIMDATEEFMNMLNQNWKILLIIILPLFYRALRKFVEEAESLWKGSKRIIPETKKTQRKQKKQTGEK